MDIKPSSLSQGTLVVATSLFWNVPVRKQVYQTPKKKKEELIKVEDLLLNFGLIHPELHLSLHHDHNLVWQKNRAPDVKSNVQQILDHEVCSNMEFVQTEEPVRQMINYKLSIYFAKKTGCCFQAKMFLMVPKGCASVDVCFRPKPDRCFNFINQRPVISKDIEKVRCDILCVNLAYSSHQSILSS